MKYQVQADNLKTDPDFILVLSESIKNIRSLIRNSCNYIGWISVFLQAVAWIFFAIFSLVRFQADYLLVIGVCLTLSIANIVGFTRCRKGSLINCLNLSSKHLVIFYLINMLRHGKTAALLQSCIPHIHDCAWNIFFFLLCLQMLRSSFKHLPLRHLHLESHPPYNLPLVLFEGVNTRQNVIQQNKTVLEEAFRIWLFHMIILFCTSLVDIQLCTRERESFVLLLNFGWPCL